MRRADGGRLCYIPGSMPAVRIANCSGFWGDRASAPAELVRGGPIDVLTGDWLAELTMALLARQRGRGGAGYVKSVVAQLEPVLAECLARGIKIVTNAGGLDPRGLLQALRQSTDRLSIAPRVAVVEGDDLMPCLDELRAAGETFAHLDRRTPLGDARVVAANAYLGGWGIAEALARGADIVVTGRVTDAALVVGPAAWRFGWRRDDWDRLAGAVAAGHILECSAQATGGNYSFFDEIDWSRPLGFPIAEVEDDGSFVVTKHPGTGGRVSIGTITAQLLYEIDGPRYLNPDVVARFDSLTLLDDGPDRVRVTGARGEPAPATLKVGLQLDGGFRNRMTVRIAGLEVDKKAARVLELARRAVGDVEARLSRTDREDPRDNDQAVTHLTLTATAPEAERVGKGWAARLIELSLASVPGYSATQPPGDASPVIVHWPALIDAARVRHTVTLGDETWDVAAPPPAPAVVAPPPPALEVAPAPAGPTVRTPLGRLFGARSGDKGGNATLGVWARTPAAYSWIVHFLTVEKMSQLFPDLAPHPMTRALLPNLRALSFTIHGLLGDGVSASTRPDPQAKTLGEYVRARVVDLPAELLR
jgi:hypothetical protein